VGVAKQAPPLPEGLPQQLEALLRGCFEADPARRPTAGAILNVCLHVGCAVQCHGLQQQKVLMYPQIAAANPVLHRSQRYVMRGV
jgi:hypothetical protein